VFKAWGFLAVFFAGVALRQTELMLAGAHKDRQGLLVPDAKTSDPAEDSTPTVSAESLVFKEHIERLSELTLVLLLGGMVSAQNWNLQTIATALFVFVVARPLSVMLGLLGSDSPTRVRSIVAWFGVRGIGSIYYLMYAINHGLPKNMVQDMIQVTIVVVMLSIVVHGTSVKPLLDRFWPKRKRES
jgi:NhaP-type Na+/H+ or K+/H+ antiporter